MSAILPRVPPRWFPGINAQLPIAGGLVYACPLNEGRGDNISNYAGGQYGLTSTATPGQLTWPKTQIGTAVRATNFGSNFFFQLGTEGGQGSNQFTDVLTDHSWSVWVYLIGGVTQCYLLGYTTPNGAAINVVYNSGTSSLQFTPGGGVYTTITGFTTDTWHHLCLVQHQTSYTIYLDGIAAATAAWPSGTGEYASGEVTILGISGNTTWNGYVSNFNFWQRPLSLGEVAAMYNDPWALYEPPKDFGLILRTNVFNYTGSGGVVIRGSAPANLVASPSSTGGVVLGGTNTSSFSANPPSSGGVVLGGTSDASVVILSTGGVVLGGTYTSSYTANPPSSGGVVLGGVSFVSGSTTPVSTGGVVVGGSATPGGSTTDVSTGGVVVGGSATVQVITSPDSTGGLVIGGSPTYYTLVLPGTSGGLVLGGVGFAQGSVTPISTGGLVLGSPSYPNGYNLREAFTIPAGKVAHDVPDFDLYLTTILPAAHIVLQQFAASDASNNALPLEVLHYGSGNGRIHAFTKVTVTAASPTTVYLYYR